MHVAAGQLAVSQLLPSVQATSHLHEALQSTSSHASVVKHLTLHGPSPHWTLLHAGLFMLPPLQVTTQAAASTQSTVPHALVPLQVIVHA